MPIKGLSDRPRRLPRLGKLHLGIKVEGEKSTYPRAVDYFVCPLEVQKVFGEKPKELDIALPVDDPDLCASVWYRCYSSYRGLVCRGDGDTASRLVDLDKVVNPQTGELPQQKDAKFWPLARRDTTKTKYFDITCNPEHCEEFGRKQCRPIMNFQFLIPRVEGVGVWQIDTSSINSIKSILDGMEIIKNLGHGRMALIPLKLALIPKEVQPEGVKKTVHILQVIAPYKIAELLKYAALPAGQALLPEPDLEPPEDLIPEEVQDGKVIEGKVLGSTVVDPEDIFSPQAIEERDRQLLWKEVCQLMADTGQLREHLVPWFEKKHNLKVSLKEVNGESAPQVATLEILTSIRDNLKLYKDQMPKKPKQEKLV